MTLREELKEKFEKDCKKTSKKFWNLKDQQMFWNEDEKLYIGLDSSKQEWISSLQHTTVPIFSVTCPVLQRKGNIEVQCGAINFIPIFKNDKGIQCRKCNKEFTVQLTIPKSSQAYKILNKLDV